MALYNGNVNFNLKCSLPNGVEDLNTFKVFFIFEISLDKKFQVFFFCIYFKEAPKVFPINPMTYFDLLSVEFEFYY